MSENNNNNIKRAGSLVGSAILKKLSLPIILIVGILLIVIILVVASLISIDMDNDGLIGGGKQLPESVWIWEEDVLQAMALHGVDDKYLIVLLAIMNQESGGGDIAYSRGDIFQSSESKCGYRYCISDPIESIKQGVKHFSNALRIGKEQGVDDETIVQAYNYGTGYIHFIAKNGKVHSVDLAKEYSMVQVNKNPSYNCGGNVNNFRYPYCYGDFTYVAKVMAYVSGGGTGVAFDEEKYKIILDESLKYEGFPYVWGGNSPQTSFDCSGFTKWVYSKAGINLPRTAQEQYNFSKKISKDELALGDLIFFKTASYNPVTHVGIYVGNNRMFDANNGGIGYSDLNSYWSSKVVGYGRVN